MKRASLLLTTFAIAALLVQCRRKQAFEYIPLSEYAYTPASIQPGTELELLAFSGGRRNHEGTVYYYQFLAINRSTGDTLRILTPLISVEDAAGVNEKTYTTPMQYDLAKGITRAWYQPQDSTHNLAVQAEAYLDQGALDTSNVRSLMDRIMARELVVVNKSIPEFSATTYPAVTGIVNFKEMPW